MEFILFWFGLAVIVAVYANTRGRNPVGWFFLAVVISPLLAGLFLLAAGGPKATPFGYSVKQIVRTKDKRGRERIVEKYADENGKLLRLSEQDAVTRAAVLNAERPASDTDTYYEAVKLGF